MQQVSRFGLVLIGGQLLSGKRVDRHLPHTAVVLKSRGQSIAWAHMAGDGRDGVVAQLNESRVAMPWKSASAAPATKPKRRCSTCFPRSGRAVSAMAILAADV